MVLEEVEVEVGGGKGGDENEIYIFTGGFIIPPSLKKFQLLKISTNHFR